MTINDHADAILAAIGLDHHSPSPSEYAAILAAVRAVYEDGQVAMREECALTAAGSFNCLDAHDHIRALTSEQQL